MRLGVDVKNEKCLDFDDGVESTEEKSRSDRS